MKKLGVLAWEGPEVSYSVTQPTKKWATGTISLWERTQTTSDSPPKGRVTEGREGSASPAELVPLCGKVKCSVSHCKSAHFLRKVVGAEGDTCPSSQSLCMHLAWNKYCIKYWCNPANQAQTHCSKASLQASNCKAESPGLAFQCNENFNYFIPSRPLQQEKTTSSLRTRHLGACHKPGLLRKKRSLNPDFFILHEHSTTGWCIQLVPPCSVWKKRVSPVSGGEAAGKASRLGNLHGGQRHFTALIDTSGPGRENCRENITPQHFQWPNLQSFPVSLLLPCSYPRMYPHGLLCFSTFVGLNVYSVAAVLLQIGGNLSLIILLSCQKLSNTLVLLKLYFRKMSEYSQALE